MSYIYQRGRISLKYLRFLCKINLLMKWAPWVIILYMLAALCWWTYLLYNKNEVIFQQQEAIFYLTDEQNEAYRDQVKGTYERQKMMIIGEGAVFTLALISGLFFLWVGYRRNIKNSESQNNFLLSVTHELKSPLASIKLAFETIKKRNLSFEQNSTISENGIYEVDRLHRQVENILSVNAIEQRYFVKHVETTAVELLKLIQTNRMYAPGEDRVHYSILGERSESLKKINIDMEGVMRIADNLINNAIKYSQEEVICEIEILDDTFVISVKDTGEGIPTEERKQIFKRFYRIGNEETRSHKGTGLGLYIVKTITDKNNGDIYITDNSPKGSVFRAELKMA